MKKLILSLAFVAFAFSLSAQSNVIKTNPLALAFGSFNATFERVVSPSSSILISGQYMFRLFGEEVNLGGLGLGYRYFFTHAKKPVPAGFYVTPQGAFSFGKVKNEDGTSTGANSFGIGAEIGYQWVWESGFVLDLGIGPMYRFLSGTGEVEGNTTGIWPSATLAIGYAF
jgi:hypothetical protein